MTSPSEKQDAISPHWLAPVTAAASILTGALVLVGRMLELPVVGDLVYQSLTLKANTGLCFLLCGVALAASIKPGRCGKIVARLCIVVTATVAFLSMLEFAGSWNFGIGEMLVKDVHRVDGASFGGRISPNTSLCLLLTSIGLWLMGRPPGNPRRPLVLSWLGSAVVGIGLFAVMGYFAGLTSDYGWWHFTRTAQYSSPLFVLFGCTLFAFAWRETGMKWLIGRWATAGFAVGLTLLVAIAVFSHRSLKHLAEATEGVKHTHQMAVKLGDMRRSVAAPAEPGAVRTEADNLLKQVNALRALATNSRQRRQLDRLESEILAPGRNGENVASIRARLHDLELAEYRKLENFADQSKTISERAFALMPFTTVLSLILVMRGLFWLNGEMAARQGGADALRQSEAGERARRAELETLMDAIPVAVFIGQGVGCQTMTSNRAGVELLRVKYGPDGQPAHERSDLKARVGGKVLQDNVLPMQLAASSGRPIMGAEFQIDFPDGEKREFFGNALPLFDDSGAVRGGISAYMDITARKRRELNNSFLQQMQAAIATASSGAEILRIASERMVEHFQLEQCLFAQVDDIREEAAVLHDCHVDGTTRLSGVYRIRDNHTEEEIRKMSSGETVVAGAMAIANHLKRGDWQLLLRALRVGSGAWADEDTRLLGELAERIYMQLERARAEKQLRESEARFRSIFNDASVPMCVATPDGRYTQANPAFCEMTGYTHDELLTMSALEITHPDDRITVGLEPLKKLVDGTIASFRDEKRYLRKDGSVIWADINVSVVRDSENQPAFLIVQIQDITGPRKAAEELSKSEELRTLAIEAGQLGIWSWNNTTRELVWSERCNVMTGQPPNAEISHVSVMDLIHPEERARVHAEAVDALINKKDIELEYRTVWPDGTIHWVQARGKSFDDENGELLRIIGIMQDVTERRKSEEALRKFNTELESLVQERTEVIQRTMLELREEIAKRRGLEEEILGISERAHARIGQDLHDDLGQQLVGIALHLQLLSAQLNAEAHPSAQEATKLKGFLVDSIVTTRNLAKSLYPVELERGGLIISLQDLAQRTELMSRAVCTVTADEAFRFDKAAEIHLYRIVQESIGNALKHGKAQHIAIDCGVREGVSTLTVTDDGVGFETRGDGKIWGMGLHLFQYRARLIGANISVTRGENGGCVVTCTMGSPAVVA